MIFNSLPLGSPSLHDAPGRSVERDVLRLVVVASALGAELAPVPVVRPPVLPIITNTLHVQPNRYVRMAPRWVEPITKVCSTPRRCRITHIFFKGRMRRYYLQLLDWECSDSKALPTRPERQMCLTWPGVQTSLSKGRMMGF